MATKESLQGDIASLEIEIKEELDLVDLDNESDILKEALDKLESHRKEYVAKTVTLCRVDEDYDIGTTDQTKLKLAEAIKNIKVKRKSLSKTARRVSEQKELAEDEDKRKRREAEEQAALKAKEDLEAAEKAALEKQKTVIKVKKANLMSKYQVIHAGQRMLYDEYNVSIRGVSDEEILRRKGEMSTLSERFGQLELQTTQCLGELTEDLYFDTALKSSNEELVKDLGILRDTKIVFENFVRQEVTDRDLSGAKKEAATEILLDKFSGGEKGLDYYSLKTKFEKKYKNVKRAQLPDILKSYMEGSALESVRQLEIEKEIWDRLKNDFGDVNVMLKKKMTKIYEVAGSFGSKKASKDLHEILVDLNNKVTDVTQLVKDHRIENKLYAKHEVNDIIAKFPSWFTNSWYSAYVKLTDKSDEVMWGELKRYLLNQSEIQKARAEVEPVRAAPSNPKEKDKDKSGKGKGKAFHTGGGAGGCPLGCAKPHSEGKELQECPKFLKVKGPKQRFEAMKESKVKFCFQCLGKYTGPEHKSTCSSDYSCPSNEHLGLPCTTSPSAKGIVKTKKTSTSLKNINSKFSARLLGLLELN